MAEEIRLFPQHGPHPATSQSDGNARVNKELRELRASAEVLRKRAERLEAQLLRPEGLPAEMRINPADKNGKRSAPVPRPSHRDPAQEA
jgi:hypothetical protein